MCCALTASLTGLSTASNGTNGSRFADFFPEPGRSPKKRFFADIWLTSPFFVKNQRVILQDEYGRITKQAEVVKRPQRYHVVARYEHACVCSLCGGF